MNPPTNHNVTPYSDYINTHTVRECHHRAMGFAQDADLLRHQGKPEDAKTSFQIAYYYMRGAAEKLNTDRESEPTRSILYRSAANCAFNAGMFTEAVQCAEEGVNGYPPVDIHDELFDVYNRARAAIDAVPREDS